MKINEIRNNNYIFDEQTLIDVIKHVIEDPALEKVDLLIKVLETEESFIELNKVLLVLNKLSADYYLIYKNGHINMINYHTYMVNTQKCISIVEKKLYFNNRGQFSITPESIKLIRK